VHFTLRILPSAAVMLALTACASATPSKPPAIAITNALQEQDSDWTFGTLELQQLESPGANEPGLVAALKSMGYVATGPDGLSLTTSGKAAAASSWTLLPASSVAHTATYNIPLAAHRIISIDNIPDPDDTGKLTVAYTWGYEPTSAVSRYALEHNIRLIDIDPYVYASQRQVALDKRSYTRRFTASEDFSYRDGVLKIVKPDTSTAPAIEPAPTSSP
jgi:hypothetical protein